MVGRSRLRRSVKRLVREGLTDLVLKSPSPRRTPEDQLIMLITGIANANPGIRFNLSRCMNGCRAVPRTGGIVGQELGHNGSIVMVTSL